ncbi:putative RNA-binding protein [Aedes camptorhynchus reo-like virus]|uniref:putative RNA-binding protein n=1 Tax=Aedes camptorhynchus reo-like virus TaxID=2010269 RepID=UPI000B5B60EC|nr:putative RNA-binding protein [Aedes camptorhynchus reo-like virus]ASA47353.1 putative RNA-binding protein [Aedes camptorhynchus reo-like virus]
MSYVLDATQRLQVEDTINDSTTSDVSNIRNQLYRILSDNIDLHNIVDDYQNLSFKRSNFKQPECDDYNPIGNGAICLKDGTIDSLYYVLAQYGKELEKIKNEYLKLSFDYDDVPTRHQFDARIGDLDERFKQLNLKITLNIPEIYALREHVSLSILQNTALQTALASEREERIALQNTIERHTVEFRESLLIHTDNLRRLIDTNLNLMYDMTSKVDNLTKCSDKFEEKLSIIDNRVKGLEQVSDSENLSGKIDDLITKTTELGKSVKGFEEANALLLNVTTEIANIKDDIKTKTQSRDKKIAALRDVIYMTSYTARHALSATFSLFIPCDISSNYLNSNDSHAAYSIIYNCNNACEIVGLVHNTSEVFSILVSPSMKITVTFPHSTENNFICEPGVWNDTTQHVNIPLVVITVNGHLSDPSVVMESTSYLSIYVMNGARSLSDEIIPYEIHKVENLSMPINIRNGVLSIRPTKFLARKVYYTRSNSSIIDVYGSVDSAVHHIARSNLTDLLLTPYEFPTESIQTPIGEMTNDIEMLKRTTVRSRYGTIRFGSNPDAYIHLNIIPEVKNILKPYMLTQRYPVTSGDRLGLARKWSLSVKTPRLPQSTEVVTPCTFTYDGEEESVLSMAVVTSVEISATTQNAVGWLSASPDSRPWYDHIVPNFSKFKDECSNSSVSSYAAVLGINTPSIATGIVIGGANTGFKLTVRIPMGIALPGVAVATDSTKLNLISNGVIITEATMSWRAVNVVKQGSQHVELYGEVDLLSSISEHNISVLVLLGQISFTGWNSLKIIYKSQGVGVSSPTLKATNGSIRYTSLPRNDGNCIKWDENLINVEVLDYSNIDIYSDYVNKKDEYQNLIVMDSKGLHYRGWPVSLQLINPELRCGILQDPIGLGNLSIIDYDKIKSEEQIQSLAVSVLNVSQMVNDQERRIALIERSFTTTSPTTIESIITTIVSVGSIVAPYLGALANVTFQLLAVNMRISDMLSRGINHTTLMNIMYEFYLTISVIRVIRGDQNRLSDINRKIYDISKVATSEITKRFNALRSINTTPTTNQAVNVNVRLPSGIKLLVKETPDKIAHDVEHIVRPLDGMKLAGNSFKSLAEKIETGKASQLEKTVFHKMRDIHLLPMHNYLKFVSYSSTHKHIDILGVSDGYAANYGSKVSTHLLGNNKFQALKIKSDGSGGLGAWRMKLEKTDGDWKLVNPASSGMTNYEILCAAGISHKQAVDMIGKSSKENLDKMVSWAYEAKSKEYLQAEQHYSVSKKNIMLLPGQFDAVHDAIRSSAGAYNYTLVRNNCQKFTDDILKLLTNTAFKPKWMSGSTHQNYVNSLENLLSTSVA